MGGRKNKGCRNNIFIVNGIIHDVMSLKKKEPVLLQIYDYRQMFDGIFLEEAISDIYDAGFNDDNLPLVYLANKQITMDVNTRAFNRIFFHFPVSKGYNRVDNRIANIVKIIG